jgi:hypothetical protein
MSLLFGTFRTCRVALTMSVDGCKADIALGRIGAFLFAPLAVPIRDDKVAYEILP